MVRGHPYARVQCARKPINAEKLEITKDAREVEGASLGPNINIFTRILPPGHLISINMFLLDLTQ